MWCRPVSLAGSFEDEKVMIDRAMILRVQKGGKNPSWRNANATNHTKKVHYVYGPEEAGYWSKPALCGDHPNGGYGWIKSVDEVTCAKCLRLLKD
jgi:hypothetical protein